MQLNTTTMRNGCDLTVSAMFQRLVNGSILGDTVQSCINNYCEFFLISYKNENIIRKSSGLIPKKKSLIIDLSNTETDNVQSSTSTTVNSKHNELLVIGNKPVDHSQSIRQNSLPHIMSNNQSIEIRDRSQKLPVSGNSFVFALVIL
jgi:hypothetical protein